MTNGVIVSLLFSASCAPQKNVEPSVPTRTEDQLLKDSIYHYYKLYSLWSDEHIPLFDPISQFTDQYSNPDQVLSALKSYTPHDLYYSGPADHFSYITNTSASNSNGLEDGYNEGYGLFFQLGTLDNSLAYPFIYFVEGGSPAAQMDVRRSDRIIALNDETDMSIPVDCSRGDCEILDQNQYNKVLNALEGINNLNNIDITLAREQDKISLTLVKDKYVIQPLSHPITFSFPETTIGYLSFSSFEHLDLQSTVRPAIQQAFADFENTSIHKLVIDLRYNGGGYVETAQHIANKICPPTANQKLMLRYETNEYLQIPRPHLPDYISFKDVYFQRENQLNLETVYFLVSKETASAAELLINVLRPYIEVVLIGTDDRTYGKPVGYFEQQIMDKVSLWVTSFRMLNADGEADYWLGMVPDKRNVSDYIFKDLADPEETMLATAIQHARTGSFTLPVPPLLRSARSVTSQFKVIGQKFNKPKAKPYRHLD